MGLKKEAIAVLGGAPNATPYHLYIHEAHANASDSNPGTDPDFPLETWEAAEAKTPLDTRANLFWHMGPHSGLGYQLTPCRQRTLRDGANWYIMGDGAGDDSLARNVLDTGIVASSDDEATFVPASIPVALAWVGKSLRWTTGDNSGAGFAQQLRTITSQSGPGGGIVLAAPVAETIQIGDGFEVFVSRVSLLLPQVSAASFDALPPLFKGTGTLPQQAPLPLGFPYTPSFTVQNQAGGRIYLVNVNLTGAPSLTDSHFLILRDSAICYHGVTNSIALGDANGTSYQGFYQGSDITMGFDALFGAQSFEIEARGALDTGLGVTDTTQWLGWGRGHIQGDMTNNPGDSPFALCIGGNFRGYAATTGWVSTNGRVALYGNSSTFAGSVFPGLGLVGAGAYYELVPQDQPYMSFTATEGAIIDLDTSAMLISGTEDITFVGDDPADPVVEVDNHSSLLFSSGAVIQSTQPLATVVNVRRGSYVQSNSSLTIENSNGDNNVVRVGGIRGIDMTNSSVSREDSGCAWITQEVTPGGTIADFSLSATAVTVGLGLSDLLTYPTLTNDRVISLHAIVWALEPATGDTAKYVVEATGYRNGAGVVSITNVDFVSIYEAQAAWDVQVDASGSDIRVRVEGEAAKTIAWRCKVIVDEHGNIS